MAPSYNLCTGQQELKVSLSVHLTNGTVSWWLLNNENDLYSFISWLGNTELQTLSNCNTGLGQSVPEV